MFKTILFTILLITVNGVQIRTGFVGIKTTLGKLSPDLLTQGFHLVLNPFTSVSEIETKPQSDSVKDVECISKEGIKLLFENIEIGNQLKEEHVYNVISRYGPNYDKYLVTDLVRHQLNVICSTMPYQSIWIDNFNDLDDQLKEFIQEENNKQETGLEIKFVRLSKPKVPSTISNNHEILANKAVESKIEVETSNLNILTKKNELLLSSINNELKLKNLENEKLLADIKNQMTRDQINAEFQRQENDLKIFKAKLEIEGGKEVLLAEAMSKNSKYFFGDVPNMIDMKIFSKDES